MKCPTLRSLENGNGKLLNSSISVRTLGQSPLFSSNVNSESLGCEVYFSTTFSRTSPLSDRTVPNDDDKENDNGDNDDVSDNNKDFESHSSLTPVLATVKAKRKEREWRGEETDKGKQRFLIQ